MLKEYGEDPEGVPPSAPWPALKLPGTDSWLTWIGTLGTIISLILTTADRLSLELIGKIVLGLVLWPLAATAVAWTVKATAVAWRRIGWYSSIYQQLFGLHSQFQRESQFTGELTSLLTSLRDALTIFPILGSVQMAGKVYLRIERKEGVSLPNSSLVIIFDFNSGTVLGKFQITSTVTTEYRAELVEVREGHLWWGKMVQQAQAHDYGPASDHLGAILIPQEADRND